MAVQCSLSSPLKLLRGTWTLADLSSPSDLPERRALAEAKVPFCRLGFGQGFATCSQLLPYRPPARVARWRTTLGGRCSYLNACEVDYTSELCRKRVAG